MNNTKPAVTKDAALIVAGGTGTRMDDGHANPSTIAKQFLPLLGMAVVDHSIRRFIAHPAIGQVYVAIRPEHRALCTHLSAMDNVHILETGGETRQETVRQSLAAIATMSGHEKPVRIFVHDAARPCWDSGIIDRLLASNTQSAAAPAVAIPDTLRRIHPQGDSTDVDRSHMYMVQTPQMFAFNQLLDLHTRLATTPVTDDAALFQISGNKVDYVTGDRNNIKITVPQDISVASSILAQTLGDVRTATGYDVHEFIAAAPDRPLMLGGVAIPHDKTLKGHSDADVVLHAITDALLGCIAAEDIGHHFSPRDARWKNADSQMFLAHARDMITAQGGLITHIDATVVCEEPKIGPHRAAMRQTIADILKIDTNRVSIKATTSEGLGFTGRREGIAAQAAATVRLPFIITRHESRQYA